MESAVSILNGVCQVGLTVLLSCAGVIGLIALASPRLFVVVSAYGSWVVNRGATQTDRRWFDIDNFVHSHARLFGFLVSGTVGYLWFISSHGPETYSKSSMLIIVAITLMMGVVALRHMMWQTQAIESQTSAANIDPLTGLANRRMFDFELSRRLARRQRQGTPLCLMILDVDNFKSVNDDYGHQFGDEALKKIGNVLIATARKMDIVTRLGGDEFAVILPGSNLEEASGAAERLRKAINGSPLRHEEHERTLTVSIGLAEAYPDDDITSLIKRSDSALYAAKESGRNCSYRQAGPEPTVPAPC